MDTLAEYACDECRSRKVTCSRVRSGCQRCVSKGTACTYSRAGIIRRHRKRKQEADEQTSLTPLKVPKLSPRHESGTAGSEPYLASDIETTRARLGAIDQISHNSLGALSSLSEACAAVWHDDAAAFGKTDRKFFLFLDRMSVWVDAVKVFVASMDRGQPLLYSPPAQVVDQLRACAPYTVQDGAWLVMFYSIILSHVSSTLPEDETTKGKLRCNLWLALNDVRLLLEPSDANIQALVILASHVEEFTTPSLSWMLASNACRMLQALGVNRRGLDKETKDRRRLAFWHLNLLDKGLAMIFGRAPTFHRAMSREIPLPSMQQLLSCQPHLRPADPTTGGGNVPSTFGAHFFHQVMILTLNLADIWHVLYEEDDASSVQRVGDELEAWYRNAHQVLSAAAMTEKPFLDSSTCWSIDLGLHMLDFNHLYLVILLARHSNQTDKMRENCVSMLNLLPNLVSDSEEVFNGIVWQLVCCPFTPFLALFGEILSFSKQTANPSPVDMRSLLEAMICFPPFLKAMGERNSLARKLEKIATVLVNHATHLVEEKVQPTPADCGVAMASSFGDAVDWESLLDVDALSGDMLTSLTGDIFSMDFNGGNLGDWVS